MIKYNSNDISDWNLGDSNLIKVYRHNAVCYYKVVAMPSPSYKWLATYTGGTTSSAECDSTSAITQNEIAKTDLESVVIGDCVTSISDKAFSGCSSLTSINIPSGVTSSIGAYTFYNCNSLTSINIPDSITTIGIFAFQGCSSLTSCTIGNGVTSIGNFAFNGCTSLTSCTIGSGVTSIGQFAFYNCTSLTSITVEATTPPTLQNNNSFKKTNNCPILVPSQSVETYKTAWSTYASRIQAIQ